MSDLLLNGRIVMGSLSQPETKNREGQPLLNSDNTPRVRYYIGLAVPKNSPEWAGFTAAIQAAALAGHPQAMNGPKFSWKWYDADTKIDEQGVAYSARDGQAGHYIVNLSSGFAPKCHSALGGGLMVEVPAEQIPRGSYVEVNWSTKANTSQTSPGVYVNLHMIRMTGYGAEIQGGANASEVFAAAAPLPAGASAVPLGTVTPVAAATVVTATPPATTVPVVTPNAAVMQPAIDLKQLTAAAIAGGMSYDKLIAGGMTHEIMYASGLCVYDEPPF